MLIEELKKAISDVIDTGVRLKAIEEQLKMPANSLSGMLSGSRPFPKKWIRKLEAYVKAHQPVEQHNIQAVVGIAQLDDAVMADVPAHSNITEAEISEVAETAKKKEMPPAGLTKSQQLRWHRENSQTLQ